MDKSRIVVVMLILLGVGVFWVAQIRNNHHSEAVEHSTEGAPVGSSAQEKGAQSSIPDFSVIAVSPADGAAVVSLADSELLTLKIGDTLPNSNLYVLQITHQKVVIRDGTSGDSWFVYVVSEDGSGRVQKMTSHIELPSMEPVTLGESSL